MAPRPVPPGGPGDDAEVERQWRDIVARLGDLDPDATPRRRRDDAPDGEPGTEPGATRDRRARPGGPVGPGARVVRPAAPSTGPGATGRPGDSPLGAPGDRPGDGAPPDQPAASDPRAWVPDPALEEAEDHFHAPDPGPVLGGDPLLTLAWVAVVGVPALLLVTVLAWRDAPTLVLQGAGALFVAAVGLLLWRMPHRRDDDDGPGAVV